MCRPSQRSQMRSNDLLDREPALAEILAASISGTIATGARRGMTQMRMGFCDNHEQGDDEHRQRRLPPLCADAEGYNLHAATHVDAKNAQGRERLLRYLMRGPLSEDRLRQLDGGRIALTLRKPLRDGTTHLVFKPLELPLELIERLVALIPEAQGSPGSLPWDPRRPRETATADHRQARHLHNCAGQTVPRRAAR